MTDELEVILLDVPGSEVDSGGRLNVGKESKVKPAPAILEGSSWRQKFSCFGKVLKK